MNIQSKILLKNNKLIKDRYKINEYAGSSFYGDIFVITDTLLELKLMMLIAVSCESISSIRSELDIHDIIQNPKNTYIIFEYDNEIIHKIEALGPISDEAFIKARNHSRLATYIALAITITIAIAGIAFGIYTGKKNVMSTKTDTADSTLSEKSDSCDSNSSPTKNDILSDVISKDASSPIDLNDFDFENYYYVCLESEDNSSASNLDADLLTITERLNMFCSKDQFEISIMNENLLLSMKKNLFPDEEAFEYTVTNFISSKGETYTAQNHFEEEKYVINEKRLTKGDFTLEVQSGTIPDLNIQNRINYYSTDEDIEFSYADNYPFLNITFSSDFINNWASEEGSYISPSIDGKNSFAICQYTRMDGNYKYSIYDGKAADSYIIFVPFFYKYNNRDFIEFGYSALASTFETDTLSTEYSCRFYPDAIEWYTKDNSLKFGTNQVPISEMKGEYSYLVFDISEASNHGDYIDLFTAFTTRMDALQIPYSIGIKENASKKYICIAAGYENMGTAVIFLLAKNSNLINSYIWNSCSYFNSNAKIQVVNEADEAYLLATINQIHIDEFEEYTGELTSSGSNTLYLCFDDLFMAKTDIDAAITDGNIRFDSFIYSGSYDTKIILDLISAVQSTPLPIYVRYVGSVYPDFAQKEETLEGMYEIKDYTLPDDCVDTITALCPNSEIKYTYTNVNNEYLVPETKIDIYMNLDFSEDIASKSIEIIEQIYSKTDMENNPSIKCIQFHPVKDNTLLDEVGIISFTRMPYYVYPDLQNVIPPSSIYYLDYTHIFTDQHNQIVVNGIFCNGRFDDYISAFRDILAKNDFIQSFNPEPDCWTFSFYENRYTLAMPSSITDLP